MKQTEIDDKGEDKRKGENGKNENVRKAETAYKRGY